MRRALETVSLAVFLLVVTVLQCFGERSPDWWRDEENGK